MGTGLKRACAPAAYTALPAPDTNRHANSSGSDPANALPSIPIPVITGPATIRGRRPRASANAPAGTLSANRATAKALRVVPFIGQLTGDAIKC